MSLTRRNVVAAALMITAAATGWLPSPALAASSAESFVESFGTQLVGIVNGPGADTEKQGAIRTLIDGSVDVDGIARFCLGRFAADASPAQLAEFTHLFHSVLVNNISSKIGAYKGVTFRMTEASMRGTEAYVGTIVTRPNNAPVDVRWVVSQASGAFKVVDVVAEGTSLRLTQRSDYASYLSHNGNSIDALINAMKRQIAGS